MQLRAAEFAAMTLGEFRDAVEAHNAANSEDAPLTQREEDELAKMIGIA